MDIRSEHIHARRVNINVNTETKTHSIPGGAALLLAGFECLGTHNQNGRKVLRFSPSAREALDLFFKLKADLETLLDEEQDAMSVRDKLR